jgi:hypothetical protein
MARSRIDAVLPPETAPADRPAARTASGVTVPVEQLDDRP